MSSNNSEFVFEKKNYVLLIIGLLVVTLGFLLMSGGGSHDPNEFNEAELFSERRITLAPLVVIAGYVVVGYAIMYKPGRNQQPGKSPESR